MQYLFQNPIPLPWLLADILTVLVTLLVVIFVVQKSRHPAMALLECFGFVFLYASIYENFAVVQGWYIYGRSLLMIGDVPLSVPLIEMDVLVTTLWLLEKMDIPAWCKPFIVGLFGMLQDFSLDPYTTRQIFTVNGITSGRWSWLLPPGAVNIYGVPVYNFPGWMLIMLYASTFFLIGRWWFRRSGYRPLIGYIYPLISIVLALITLITPLSQFLLWLGPLFNKGSNAEWIMLIIHLTFPSIILILFWRGKMKQPITLKTDLPIFVLIGVMHLSDIIFTITGGYKDILWLILVISLVHIALLWFIVIAGKRLSMTEVETRYDP
jgi:hypothetical protein